MKENTLREEILVFIERGVDIIRIGMASNCELSIGQVLRMYVENGLTFTCDSDKDEIIVEKIHE